MFLEFLATNSTSQQRSMLSQVLAEHTASGVAPKIAEPATKVSAPASRASASLARRSATSSCW